jgi:hypothetical protein
MPAGDSVTVFRDDGGWAEAPGQPTRELHGADLDSARIDADLQFALDIKTLFPQLRVEYPEKIDDKEVYVLSAIAPGHPAVKLYFDKQSGLLLRLVRYADSPIGLDPTQIDYDDYRIVDGVQVPFRWKIAQAGEISMIQWEQVKQNVPIDDSRFLKPVAEERSRASTP